MPANAPRYVGRNAFRYFWHEVKAKSIPAGDGALELRYAVDQPRVPAGNPDGGQWTSGGPGGATNFGITIADYRKYVKPGATAADVRAMKVDEAKTIYRARYWNALRCDELPSGPDYAAFDYGVNSGTSRAVKVLQRIVGLPDDGRITDSLIAAVLKRDESDLVIRICDERLAFLHSLRTWPVFGKGWGPRVADVKVAALAMAKRAPKPAGNVVPSAPGSHTAHANTKLGDVLARVIALFRRAA